MKTVFKTGKEIYEAIEKDGFGMLREAFFQEKDGKVQACLLGTAGLNLGVAVNSYEGSLQYELNKFTFAGEPIGDYIINSYDDHITLNKVAEDYAQDNYSSYNDFEILYNEKLEQLKLIHGDVDKYEHIYRLETWEECLAMAKEALTNVWDIPFKLKTRDYSNLNIRNWESE